MPRVVKYNIIVGTYTKCLITVLNLVNAGWSYLLTSHRYVATWWTIAIFNAHNGAFITFPLVPKYREVPI